MTTRVLVADSLSVFRAGVSSVLGRSGGWDVSEASDLDGVHHSMQEHPPEVALIDLGLPPLGGVAAVRALAKTGQTKVIIWSLAAADDIVLTAIRAGAAGCLPKQISPVGLVRALHGTVRGEAPITRGLAGAMIAQLHQLGEREQERRRAASLTAREREVIELLATGARNGQIATALAISEFTVKRHIQNILQKLELPSRRSAAAFYRDVVEHSGAFGAVA
jgi:DNA-binding NarL/FixJ family response regulator